MRLRLRAQTDLEFAQIKKDISSTHIWNLKIKPGMAYYECRVCKLDAFVNLVYPLQDALEPVTDKLPVLTWNHKPLYLTCAQNLERKALKKVKNKPWVVYILECWGQQNSTLYTGITNNLYQRFMDHKEKRGAKYTKKNYPLRILYTEKIPTKSEAAKREYQIKQLTRDEKLDLIKGKP